MYTPKFSILTPSFNQGSFIEKTILSVLNQNYENFEHIIIDGGSTDNTIEVLKKYPHIKWVSEKDDGQADALNKGLKLATGNIIGWINSDDFYEDDIFISVARIFNSTNIHWVIGNMNELNIIKKTVTKIDCLLPTFNLLLKNPDIVKQPPSFYTKEIINKVGGWDPELYMVMDLDLWLKISKITPPVKINIVLANFVIHEHQKTNISNINKQLKEIIYVLKKQGASISNIIKIFSKKKISLIKQTIKRYIK